MWIMARRRVAGRRPLVRQRRKTIWARVQNSLTVPATGTVAIDDLFTGAGTIENVLGANALPGATIGRIRGVITCLPTAFGVASGCRVGFRIDRDSSTGLAAEGPFTTPYLDWMGFEPFQYALLGAGAQADLQHQVPALCRTVDIKSMRKLGEISETLFLVAESVNATTWSLTYDLSMLILMP